MRKTILVTTLITGCALGTTSCAPKEKTHGNLIQEYQMERIEPGKHTRQSVLKLLGSPTTKAPFDDNKWYYIGQKTEAYGIRKPDIVDQKIVLVEFAEDGKVSQITNIDAQSYEDLPVVASETPTAGTDKSPLERFFGNLGRFNQPVPTATQNDGTGGPGAPR